MFRKPREAVSSPGEKPSTGRPPTPPSLNKNTSFGSAATSPAAVSPLLPLGRSQTAPRVNSRNISMGKPRGKTNGSILNFFKKADSSPNLNSPAKHDENSLFIEENSPVKNKSVPTQTPTPPRDQDHPSDSDSPRYNENPQPIKRLRTDSFEPTNVIFDSEKIELRRSSTISVEAGQAAEHLPSTSRVVNSISEKGVGNDMMRKGPFVEDSDSEDETVKKLALTAFGNSTKSHQEETRTNPSGRDEEKITEEEEILEENIPKIHSLKRETTSILGEDGFEGIEDFIDDEFPEDGEEYLERRWMEEQGNLEHGLEENDDAYDIRSGTEQAFEEESTTRASQHVNDCLDGKPNVMLKSEVSKNETNLGLIAPAHKRFQRAAIARPGQNSPFTLGGKDKNSSSAFSKLMSSHAEDAAWATAAAAEMSARGKPAFKRTCPFYKIMPGFFICVDAFRYGAVEGCNAYFLSHFHSDHYIGLTSSWCHGPIYCSRVTANLVRRQLRVDPKWVVDLEFDRKIEVPGTEGVEVTMIPANHCPGSSLYLFEKTLGKGRNPKVQRVLHCGDFRACPAHIQHPMLRPDLKDLITGKQVGQQKLDVCYLDTTYLTPKYAFPSQEEVIKACADMCVSLSKERVDATDAWEQTKKERAGSGMVKFVQKTSELVEEEEDEDDSDAMKVGMKNGSRRRGRLLVICGTYSIGKERICLGIAKALNSKIYATPNKQKICAALEDPELMARMTNDPLEAQVHMQMLMEIRAETLADYLTGYKPHFSRIVGFRPSGWNYRPPNSRFVESPAVQTVLHSDNWKSQYSMAELVPQRGSTREASCFGVPYSEHSSFRELTMFCCALRIDKIIPTVNVGSAKSREKMKAWCEKWAMEKKKNGLFKVADGQTAW